MSDVLYTGETIEQWAARMKRMGEAAAEANRAYSDLRYRLRIANEKQKAWQFLNHIVREARADIRARGLNIPRR